MNKFKNLKIKKIAMTFLMLYAISNISFFASCAEKQNNTDENYVFNLITSPKDAKELKKCLFLGYEKGHNKIVYNLATKFIIKEILTPIEKNVQNLNLFFVRMPVGIATVDLPINYSSNKAENKKIESFLNNKILNSKIENELKKVLKDKTKVKNDIEKIITKFQEGLEKEIKIYEKKITNLKNEINGDNFYYDYGKKYLNSQIYSTSTNDINGIRTTNDDLTIEEETKEILKQYLDKKQFVIRIGRKMYENNLNKYQDVLKDLKDTLKELKSNVTSEQKKEELMKKVIECLGFVNTKNKVVNYNDKYWRATIMHILEANNIK